MKTIRTMSSYRWAVAGLGVLLTVFAASPAHAFRCGNKIVIENMHEAQVRNVCGEPATERHLGFTLRYVEPARGHGRSGRSSARQYERPAYYVQEVAITELVYNFGPRKFMRRLVFEGGILVSIETIGYGYREHRK